MGAAAPHFRLTDQSLADRTLADYAGKRVVINIFPSVDTPVCAMSVRQFNQAAGSLRNTVVLAVSRDLPFAFARFCGAEGLQNVVTLSEMRALGFGEDWGVRIVDGRWRISGACVVVLDEQHRVIPAAGSRNRAGADTSPPGRSQVTSHQNAPLRRRAFHAGLLFFVRGHIVYSIIVHYLQFMGL
jgi:thiol peroxidase